MNRLLLFLLLSLALPHAGRGAVIFTSVSIPIPLTLDGIYLNPLSGATSGAQPVGWNTAPWLNPLFGGVFFANDDLARPIVTGVDQIVNLGAGTIIDATGNFVAGESGSTTHIGAAPGQFQLGVPGYVGFTFQPTVGGPVHYGWLSATFDNTGAATIDGYAIESTPNTGILAGATGSIPEPSRALLLMVGLMGAVGWRRRCYHQNP